MKKHLFLFFLIGTTLLAGCSQQAPGGNQTAGTPLAASTKPKTDLCAILKGEDVSALVGYTVAAAQSGSAGGCNYKSSDSTKGYSIGVELHEETDAKTAQDRFQSELDYQKKSIDPKMAKIVDVPGVGEKASLVTTSFSGNLLVLSSNVWMSVNSAGSDEQKRSDDLTKVAVKVLSVL